MSARLLLAVVVLVVPSKLQTRFDLLDTLRDGEWWTPAELIDDTGRSQQSISSVLAALDRLDLIEWVKPPGQVILRKSRIRATDKGLRWLWCVDRDLPGQAADTVFLVLDLLADGPIVTSQLRRQERRGHFAEVVLTLRAAGVLKLVKRAGRTGDQSGFVHVTDLGRALYREMKEEPCFKTLIKTSSRVGSTQ